MKADPKTQLEVLDIFDRIWQAYKGKDIDAFMCCYADDEDVVIFGSSPGETIYGASQIRDCVKRDFAQWESIDRKSVV